MEYTFSQKYSYSKVTNKKDKLIRLEKSVILEAWHYASKSWGARVVPSFVMLDDKREYILGKDGLLIVGNIFEGQK